ncbi:MAG: L,D-transpeptidase family protein [Hyphomicrobiales bacterium]
MLTKNFMVALGLTTLITTPTFAANISKTATHVVIDRNSQTLKVYNGTEVIAKSRVSTGKSGYTTPSGVFSILQKRRRHFSNIYNNAPMPNMQRLTWTGIALHGSNSVPNRPASHGCIRLPRGFDAKLFKMTQFGAHVIVSRGAVAPTSIQHDALFRPNVEINDKLVANEASSTNDGERPSAVLARLAVNEGRKVKKSDGKSGSPLRILITRGGTENNETLQVQQMLNELGWNAGEEDGFYGGATKAAIERFQSLIGEKTTGRVTLELVKTLRQLTGKGAIPTGRIYVRQDFRPVFDAPIHIKDAHLELGAHLLSLTALDKATGTAEWTSMSLRDRLSKSQRSKFNVTETDAAPQKDINDVLSRFDIPQDVRDRIESLLTKGSSVSISDKGFSNLTSPKGGTDFILRTSG